MSGARKRSGGCNWFQQNVEQIAQADAILCERIRDRSLCKHANKGLCEEVLSVLRSSLSTAHAGSESSSVLLLGESGSGKSHAVEECLARLNQEREGASAVVLRAHGGVYNTDVECMRHLATQVAQQVRELPDGNASFEQSMEWLRSVLKESFKQASAAIIVLDRFEHFCSRSRQTLLYNLFDVAQEAGVRICIIGMSEKMDVMGLLEKRIKSRFTMRHVHALRPTSMSDLIEVLMSKLALPHDCGLKTSFITGFNKSLEAALQQKEPEWQSHLDLGRPPSWFLSRCLPVAALLHELCEVVGDSTTSAAKRSRKADAARCLPSGTWAEVNDLLVASLSEAEHIVLVALFRMRDRRASATMRTVLHEIELLHQTSKLVFQFDMDGYIAAFDRLVQMKLINVRSPGTFDAGRRHMPCESKVHGMYLGFVCDLEKSASAWLSNPLRSLPGEVQQWAARQRPQEDQLGRRDSGPRRLQLGRRTTA
jgi:energy-coupling factor transporter ATP-binding protein EcfA2